MDENVLILESAFYNLRPKFEVSDQFLAAPQFLEGKMTCV